MEQRLGTDRDVERRKRRARRVHRDHTVAHDEPGDGVSDTGDAGTELPEESGAAAPATGGLHGIAPLAAMGAVTFDDARVATRTAGDRAAAPTDDQVSAPAAIQDAQRATARVERAVQRGTEHRREQAGPGRLITHVDHVEAGPTLRTESRGCRDDRVASELDGLRGRGRRHERERGSGPVCALGDQIPRVPRRCALFGQGRVGVVEDDDAGEVGHRREHRDPAADHHARSPPRVVPGHGPKCSRVIATNEDHVPTFVLQRRGDQRSLVGIGDDDERRSHRLDERTNEIDPRERGRPDHEPHPGVGDRER